MGDPITVLVVEADLLMSKAISQRLSSSGAAVVGEARTNVEALVDYAQHHPQLVTLDVRLGRESGFVLVADLVTWDRDAIVLLYSASVDVQLARRAVAAGAAGYLRRDVSRAELEDCLRLAVAGVRPVFDQRTWTALAAGAVSPGGSRAQTPRLTARQRQVLQLMAAGTTSNKALASKLFISEKTVKSHIEQLAASLDVSHRSDLALRALELGVELG